MRSSTLYSFMRPNTTSQAGDSAQRPARRQTVSVCKHRRGASPGSHPCCTAHAHGCRALQNCLTLHYAPDGTGRWLLPRLPVWSRRGVVSSAGETTLCKHRRGASPGSHPCCTAHAYGSCALQNCLALHYAPDGTGRWLLPRLPVVSPGRCLVGRRDHTLCATHLAMRARAPIPHPAASAQPPGAI